MRGNFICELYVLIYLPKLITLIAIFQDINVYILTTELPSINNIIIYAYILKYDILLTHFVFKLLNNVLWVNFFLTLKYFDENKCI